MYTLRYIQNINWENSFLYIFKCFLMMRLVFCFTQHVLMNKNITRTSFFFFINSLVYVLLSTFITYFLPAVKVFFLSFLPELKWCFWILYWSWQGKIPHWKEKGLFSFSKILKLSWFQNIQIYATEPDIFFNDKSDI